MRILVRAARPLEPGPVELCSCPDTHDRGVAWSWSVSAIVGSDDIDDVLVSGDDAHVEIASERLDVTDALDVSAHAGEEVVIVVMRDTVELRAEDGWRARLASGDVLVSDGEQPRHLEVSAQGGARIHVVRLRWRDARPMRWVP